jgi:hypothetical protein
MARAGRFVDAEQMARCIPDADLQADALDDLATALIQSEHYAEALKTVGVRGIDGFLRALASWASSFEQVQRRLSVEALRQAMGVAGWVRPDWRKIRELLNGRMSRIPKIVSAGQTGADRAALDWALSHNLPCGGWCPKGRKAEDGTIDPKYPLQESSSISHLQRTEWNVRDSDATVLFSINPLLSGASRKTVEFALKHKKPCLHVHAAVPDATQRFSAFLEDNAIEVLNVAGPRAGKEPAVYRFVIEALDHVFNF